MSGESIDVEELRKAFCPPIDDAVFYAIASDFDLRQDHDKLHAILDDLRAAAIEEEGTSFDPSGTGGVIQYHEQPDVSRTTPEGKSTSNEATSITTALTDLRLSNISGSEDAQSVEEKTQYLRALFPDVSTDRIARALHDAGSLDHAVDELLNLSFLGDGSDDRMAYYQSRPTGIEAFAEELRPQQRKGRGKKKARTNESSRASSVGSFGSDVPQSSNAWSEIAGDVEFICSRTILNPSMVTSVYHANGARLQPTLRALAEKHGSKYHLLQADEPAVDLQITEVTSRYNNVPEAQIYGFLLMTRNHPSAVCELVEAMMSPTHLEVLPSGKLQGVVSYAPVDLHTNDEPTDSGTSWAPAPSNNSSSQLAAAHGLAASQAFSQASAAYKRSKSDRLMGGAAAYYASVGHERLKEAKQMNAAAADAHVQSQSTTTVLDLHGTSVTDAVRIANTQAQRWWDSLGDAKYFSGGRGAARTGYRIVTGVGSHSKNHAPRLGPAVSKALIKEGWKVEIGHGELVVTGKVSK